MIRRASVAFFLLLGLTPVAWAAAALPQAKTVCTVTVNSADEKEAMRRALPKGTYEFVELVERGRPDWLESSCRKGVRCDVLLISGHYDGGNEFFSDQLGVREYLPVAELERVSCSNSCPGLFSRLKEVYLFGCNTLNPEANRTTSGEIGRSLRRAGHAPAEAERLARTLTLRHGESSRDRMRLVFPNVPVIYGFSSTAPLGPVAGTLLAAHFAAAGTSRVASARPDARLLERFSAHSMVVTRGITEAEPQAEHRRDVCRFADDRLAFADKLGFVHELLRRDIAEVRLFLDRIEAQTASLDAAALEEPAVAAALRAIASDDAARERFIAFARDADEPRVRARMVEQASRLGWLSPEARRTELIGMIDERLAAGPIGPADVDLVCELNRDGDLDPERPRLRSARAGSVGDAAILACLGDAGARARVLQALTSADVEEVQIAQVFLRHHPISDVQELRLAAAGIAQMRAPEAQVRALDALARHRVTDGETLDRLARLFAVAATARVQSAIAGVLVRADYETLARPEVVAMLRQQRLAAPAGGDIVDVLIRRLEAR